MELLALAVAIAVVVWVAMEAGVVNLDVVNAAKV